MKLGLLARVLRSKLCDLNAVIRCSFDLLIDATATPISACSTAVGIDCALAPGVHHCFWWTPGLRGCYADHTGSLHSMFGTIFVIGMTTAGLKTHS